MMRACPLFYVSNPLSQSASAKYANTWLGEPVTAYSACNTARGERLEMLSAKQV